MRAVNGLGIAALLVTALAAAAPDPPPSDPRRPDPIESAETLLEKRDYRGAELAFREILKTDPSNARAHGNLALALLEQKKTREAIDEGRLAAAFGPNEPEARYIYGWALLEGGRPEEAARELEKAVAARPNAAPALSALADAYAATKDPRAPAAREKLILLEPGSARHRAALAELYWSQEKYADGNRVAEEAIAAIPTSADLQTRYGRALVQQGLFLDGVKHLEAARARGASSEAFLLLLASAQREGGRVAEAEDVLSSAAREYPDSPAVRGDYGRLLLASGRTPEALAELQVAARLDPGDAGLQLDLGRALETFGQLDEAEAVYREGIRLAPRLPRGHYALGRLLMKRGRREEAEKELATHRELYDRGLELVSASETRAGELAMAQTRLRDGDAAQALSLFRSLPESADSLVGAAEALSRLGRHAEAVRTLEKARTLAPEDKRIDPLLASERSRAADAK
jgi:tetratricopeptide (TPR) repeat protein